MLRRFALAAALTATTLAPMATTQASEVELSLSDEMAQVMAANRARTTETQGLLYGGSFLFNEDDDLLGTAFLNITNRGNGRWQPVTVGVGGKLFVTHLDRPDENVGALGLGGNIAIGIPADIPMAIVLEGYLSPNITTSGDADRLTEVMLRYEVEVTRGAHAFLGYRQVKVHSSDFRDVRLDNGLHAGVRLRF